VTEPQFITFILGFAATITTVLIAILINNARLNDTKDALRAEIRAVDSKTSDLKETLRADIRAGAAAILSQMATYQMDVISKLAELDNRITRLRAVGLQPPTP